MAGEAGTVDGAQEPVSPARSSSRRTWWFVAAVGAAASLGQVLAVRAPGLRDPEGGVGWLACVAVGFTLAELLVVHVRVGRDAHALSFSEVPLVVGLVFLPPEQLLLARLAGSLPAFALRRRTVPVKITFNVAWQVLEVAVAVLVWGAVLGAGEPFGPRGWAATAAAVVATSLLGSALVSAAIALHGNGSSRLREAVTIGLVMDLVNASLATAVVLLLAAGRQAAWLVVVILLVLAFAYRSHERLRQRTEALERLNRFTAHVGNQQDVEGVVTSALAQVRDAVEAGIVVLQLHDDPASPTAVWTMRGDTVVGPDSTEPSLVSAVAPWLGAEPMLVPRDRRSRVPRSPVLRAAQVRDLLVVPLTRDGVRVGALLAANRIGDLDTFTRVDLLELESLANHAGVALDNTRRADLLRTQVAERAYQALHDELTGLFNRRGFLEALGAVDKAAVLMLDLDRFKEINDTLGHHAGDRLLNLAAERIRTVAPEGCALARVGGDEFAALLPGADEACARAIAGSLRSALAQPFPLDGLSVAVDASIGIEVTLRRDVPGTLLRHADVAMYVAKAARSGVEVYRPELDRSNPERLTMLTDLRDALASGGLTVAYQPKVRLGDGAVCGMEALVRWQHPRLGFISPEDFVPLAEHSGLINELTSFVLGEALGQCETWRQDGPSLGVAVNLSPRTLLDPAFPELVARALARVAVSSGDLTLEITEGSLMTEPEAAIEVMHRIRDLGVQLSIDDMGTGYSSLAYLQRLPVDEVKIDRSFLDTFADPASEAVVSAVIDLGHRLDRTVVAEGVEDEITWERLRRLGCDLAQGYWISRPMPAAAVRPWLASWRERRVTRLRAVP
jgi:diguanylate cyclase (GGDEF)-like protein